MKRWLPVLLGVAMAPGMPADEPAPPLQHDACQVPDNRILGPRTLSRPVPLLAGDPTGGFHPACAVPWATLSPNNQPLAVVGCYRGNLLQVANDSACGRGTGPLWVSLRWVVTSGEARQAPPPTTACQQLETGSYAATRDFQPECAPQSAAPARPARAPTPTTGATSPGAPTSSAAPTPSPAPRPDH
jgi:hypothetical protein